MNFALKPTVFHSRTLKRNLANAWVARGPFTVAAHYGDPHHEALAARLSAVLIDVSALEDLRIAGAGAEALLASACGAQACELLVGGLQPVFWCADGGGLRGLGMLSRLTEDDFRLRSADADAGWFATAAPRFKAVVREASLERGLLLLAGPFAGAVLKQADVDTGGLKAGQCTIADWNGHAIALCHDGAVRGYYLSCPLEAAGAVFDALLAAGAPFGLQLAGQATFDLLLLEGGMVLPNVDFHPARENFAREPLPSTLGLAVPVAAGSRTGARVLAGLLIDGDEPCAFMPLWRGNAEVGRTLRSAYSPAFRRGIALEQIEPPLTAPGNVVGLRMAAGQQVRAHVVALPFLS